MLTRSTRLQHALLRTLGLASTALLTLASCGGGDTKSGKTDGAVPADAGRLNRVDAMAPNNGGANGTSGDASTSSREPPLPASFSNLTLQADIARTPVADCKGQPDFAPCILLSTPDLSHDVCVQDRCVSPGCAFSCTNPPCFGHCDMPAPHVPIVPLPHSVYEIVGTAEPVMVDLATGLHWAGCARFEGNVCVEAGAEPMNWRAAVLHCDQLEWGGHKDWYLPDLHELTTLLGSPLSRSSWSSNSNSYSAWQMRTDVTDLRSAFQAHHRESPWPGGSVVFEWEALDLPYPVTCVRRGFSPLSSPSPRFEAIGRPNEAGEAEAVVRDRTTRLMWMRCVAGLGGEDCRTGQILELSVAEAIDYCWNLSYLGFDDWHLPDVRENISLHDISYDDMDPAFKTPVEGRSSYLPTSNGLLFSTSLEWVFGTGGYDFRCVRSD